VSEIMNFLNIIEENLPFLVIGLMIIVIVVLAYYTFIKPKPNKHGKETKKAEQDQSIIKQDSEILNQTSKASPVEKSSEDEEENQDDSSNMDSSKPVIIETGEVVKNSSKEDSDSNIQTSEKDDASNEQDKDDSSKDEEEKTELGKYHITYRQKDNKWIVVREGSDKTIRVLHTKKEAIAYATIKAINQDTNIVIHGEDGKIEKHGY